MENFPQLKEGTSRDLAAQKLGMSGKTAEKLAVVIEAIDILEVPVIVSDMTDQLDIEEAVIIANKQRDKTKEQKGREYEHLKKIEEIRAKERQAQNAINHNTGISNRENFPHSETGRTRDLAAQKLGMSGKTAEKLAVVIEAIDILHLNVTLQHQIILLIPILF